MFAFLTRVDSQPVVAQPIGAAVIEVEAPAARQAPRGQSAPAVAHVASKPTDPVKIVISSIGVNADIHGLGTNEKGEIAVPKAYGLVGWYNKGKTVSEAGPTVLVGHYAGGGGAVFDRLGNVKNGDLITVTTKEGKTYTYKVSKKVEYHKDKVPMQQIFKAGESSRLEIITCQGAWAGNTYDNRLVVTAELVR
jgi:sortase (surface protein transpeptidase)